MHRFSYALICSAWTIVPQIALADTSQVIKSWRTDAGWLTELRQHTDGARVCATGKAFKEADPLVCRLSKAVP